MAEKDIVETKEKIEKGYWDAVLLKGTVPASVYALCESIGVKESDFYDFYASLEHIESSYWADTLIETIAVLEQDEDYASYDFSQKLLSFYFTYFAHIQPQRSRFLERFPSCGIRALKELSKMRSTFTIHIDQLITQGMEEGCIVDRKMLNTHYSKGIFEQFKAAIVFYKDDSSEKFQDTDAFIEKSTKVVFDGLGSGLLDSLLDVARFMVRKTPFGQS